MEKHTIESITSLLERSNQAVERAMVVLFENKEYIQDFRLIMHFACYIQGWHFMDIGKKYWEPKSLTHPHCHKSLIKSCVLPVNSAPPIETARELAISNVRILVAIANNEEILKEELHIWTSRGARRDTVSCIAVLESAIESYPDFDKWPYKSERKGKPTSSHYEMLVKRVPGLKLTEESFLANYTLVEETDCYLD